MLNSLPAEVFRLIASYLDDWDLVSLTAVDDRIAHYVASTKRKLSLTPYSGTNYESSTSVLSFLTLCSNYGKLSRLDLSNCYWLDEGLVVNIVHLTSYSIRDLFIHGTSYNPSRLAAALQACKFLSILSLSLNKRDYEFWVPENYDMDESPEEYNPNKFVLSECQERLKMITSLGLYCDDLELPTLILCFCESLRSLHIEVNTGASLSFNESFRAGRRLRKLRPYLPNLKSLASVTGRINTIFEAANLFAEFASSVLTGLSNQLKVLWLPNFSANQYEGCLQSSVVESLQTLTLPPLMTEYKMLKYIRTPHLAFLSRLALRFELLKGVSCCYDPEYFGQFASAHENLNVLQLMSVDGFSSDLPVERQQSSKDSLAKGLAHFHRLEKLSVGFGVAYGGSAGGSFLQLSNNFSFLNEFEFGLFLQNLPLLRARGLLDVSFFPRGDDLLCSLSQLVKLQKLTLANICASRYELVSQILKSCPFLRSLRLSNVICEESPSEWIDSLKEGLAQAKHLEDFRYSIDDGTHFGGMIRITAIDSQPPLPIDSLMLALHSCQSLRRFAILSTKSVTCSTSIELEWPSLVLACFVLPERDSLKVTLISSNPAYTLFAGCSVADASIQLPAIHYNDLIILDSKVCKMPNGYENDFQP